MHPGHTTMQPLCLGKSLRLTDTSSYMYIYLSQGSYMYIYLSQGLNSQFKILLPKGHFGNLVSR